MWHAFAAAASSVDGRPRSVPGQELYLEVRVQASGFRIYGLSIFNGEQRKMSWNMVKSYGSCRNDA